MRLLRKNYKICIGIIVGAIISVTGVVAATTYAIHSENVEYQDNSNLDATNVQDAIDSICTKVDTRLEYIENKDDIVSYSAPFSSLPTGYSASAYKSNGVVVITMIVPGETNGWLTTSSFSLITELRPSTYINGTYRYSSYYDINKIFMSLNADGTVFGYVNNLTYDAFVQFQYPVAS